MKNGFTHTQFGFHDFVVSHDDRQFLLDLGDFLGRMALLFVCMGVVFSLFGLFLVQLFSIWFIFVALGAYGIAAISFIFLLFVILVDTILGKFHKKTEEQISPDHDDDAQFGVFNIIS